MRHGSMSVPVFCKKLFVALAVTLLFGCSDSSDNQDNFNVRVFGVDAEGNAVDLASLYWGFGTFEFPEGRTSIFCNAEDFNEGCTSLDIGFEAQGGIWIEALSPLPGTDPQCVFWLSGESQINADPSQRQVVTIVVEKPNGICS